MEAQRYKGAGVQVGDAMNYDKMQLLRLAIAANLESVRLLCEQVEATLQTLDDRELRVLELRFGLEDGRGHTLQQIADDFNVSRERIRLIEVSGLRKVRQTMQGEGKT